MHHRLAKVVLGVAAAASVPVSTWAQNNPAPQAAAQQESPYKDQGEYDIVSAATKETDPQKKLDKVKEWEQKYPDSKLKDQRTLLQAQALLQIAATAFTKTDAPSQDAAQKAAQQIVDNMNTYFAPSVKPAQVSDQQWNDIKKTFTIQSHSALGWVAMQRKTDGDAEKEFKAVLEADPSQAQVSYWLGSVILRQRNLARYPEALYHIARAVSVTGANALPPAAVTQYDAFLKRAYSQYHGDTSGLDDLKRLASASPMPPAGFAIESVTDIEKKKFANQEEFNKAHPDIALWRQIRDGIQADPGYFEKVKGSEIPPPEIKVFKAKVVSVTDKDLLVNVDNASGDAILRFEKALNAKVIEAGTEVSFKGVVEAFNKEPYSLTLTIGDPKTDITGLPATAFGAGAPAKRPVPAHRPVTHKK